MQANGMRFLHGFGVAPKNCWQREELIVFRWTNHVRLSCQVRPTTMQKLLCMRMALCPFKLLGFLRASQSYSRGFIPLTPPSRTECRGCFSTDPVAGYLSYNAFSDSLFDVEEEAGPLFNYRGTVISTNVPQSNHPCT